MVQDLAYRYFKRCPESAQLVGFILAINVIAQRNNCEMFNDCIVQFYLVLSTYLLVYNWPKLGALMIGLALTVKAGPLLAVPAFLGVV